MSMKIVAGIGCVDDYFDYVEAGADELFCGYVPAEYMQKFGRQYPANRREVLYYNVQIGSESELLILRRMIEKAKVPVSIAFNGLFYEEEQREFIAETVKQCMALGYKDFIVAEPKLLAKLDALDGIRLTVSGELGEMNEGVIRHVAGKNVRRLIFPRQTCIEEMSSLNDAEKRRGLNLEHEAFALNEKCHFTGAYCCSLHCDELCHICKLPYRLTGKTDVNIALEGDDCADDSERFEVDECTGGKVCAGKDINTDEVISDELVDCENEYVLGETGCAVCLLWKMRSAGVTHLKIVSRGNNSEATINDIKCMRIALDILEDSKSEDEYVKRIFSELFPNGCKKNCYTQRYSNPM